MPGGVIGSGFFWKVLKPSRPASAQFRPKNGEKKQRLHPRPVGVLAVQKNRILHHAASVATPLQFCGAQVYVQLDVQLGPFSQLLRQDMHWLASAVSRVELAPSSLPPCFLYLAI